MPRHGTDNLSKVQRNAKCEVIMTLFTIDEEKCTKCGICIEECPYRLIEVKKNTFPKPSINADKYCMECGHCVAVCPTGSFSHRSMSPQRCQPLNEKLLPSDKQVEELLKSRRSIRSFLNKPVPSEMLEKIIDTANYAPTGLNAQAVRWMVIKDRVDVQRYAAMAIDYFKSLIRSNPERANAIHAKKWVENWGRGIDSITWGAPHVIVAYADGARWDWEAQIALSFLDLAAYSHGLGSCWAGLFTLAAKDWEPMNRSLGLPEGYIPLGAMMVGYPKNKFRRIPIRREYQIMWK
jgi:nitroreductase/ferredoxin